jgi:transcriptional regulator with XRE-family HTH domain
MLINFEVLRAKKQMTKGEFSKFIGVSPPTYRSWLNGGPIPSIKLLELSNTFNCSVDYLLDHDFCYQDGSNTGQQAS